MKEPPFSFRFVEVRSVRYLWLDDVAAFLRELGGSEETDVRKRLDEAARRITSKGCEVPTWWPPKAGTKLRRMSHIQHVEALLHVLAVFVDKDGEERIVTAEWSLKKRRWNYTVMWWHEAAIGLIWRDGTKKPECP